MAGSPVDAANKALALVTSEPIRSLDERSRSAALCNTFYPAALREALEAFDFPETKTTAWLNQVEGIVTGPWVGKWAFAYQLPPDYVKARYIDTADLRYPIPYELSLSANPLSSQLYLFTNAAVCPLVYTTSRVDIAHTSASFSRVVEYNLAKLIAGPLRKRMDPRSALVQEYMRELEAIKASLANTEPELMDMEFVPLAIREQFS